MRQRKYIIEMHICSKSSTQSKPGSDIVRQICKCGATRTLDYRNVQNNDLPRVSPWKSTNINNQTKYPKITGS